MLVWNSQGNGRCWLDDDGDDGNIGNVGHDGLDGNVCYDDDNHFIF